MRIAIISGGKNKAIQSMESADNIFMELSPYVEKIFNIKINEREEWVHKGIKTLPHATLIHADYVIDLTHDTHDVATKNFIKSLGLRHLMSEEYDQDFLRGILRQIDIAFPKSHKIIKNSDLINEIHSKWREIHLPVYVRASNNKVVTLKTYSPDELYKHSLHIHKKSQNVILDEHVIGRKYSLTTISKFRGQDIYSTPIMEKLKKEKKLFLSAKTLDENIKAQINKMSEDLHRILDSKILKHDFVVTKNGPVLVNLETRPTYKKDSSFYNMLNDAGITFFEIVKSFK